MKLKKIYLPNVCRYFLCAWLVIGFGGLTAEAVEFVSQKEFRAVESAYKDYPVQMLFKMLDEGNAMQRKEIRNMIVLKQVFDSTMREREERGLFSYDRAFGIVKEISGDKLKLWVSERERHQEFYLGIDRIPVVNKHLYKLTESNIGRFALIAYTMDDRIYKLEINFELAAPDGLYVKREGEQNIVGWQEPEGPVKPYEYKVFINGTLFSKADQTFVQVPRKEGKVDQYSVKAIYKHGKSFVDSIDSQVLKDEITAKELAQAKLAEDTYNQIVAMMTPVDWEQGKNLLYTNQQLLSDYLDAPRKAKASDLTFFFKDIDGGDQISGLQPVTTGNLYMALTFYQRAEEKAGALMPDVDVQFLPRLKINQNAGQKELLAQKNEKQNALDTYDQIVAALTPQGWEGANTRLYENEQLLVDNLDPERKANVTGLIEFFDDINEGDRISGMAPVTLNNFATAMTHYKLAEQRAKTLPASLGVLFIAQLKINDTEQQTSLLQKKSQETMAMETYERVVSKLTPLEWESAKTLLYDQQQLLTEHLDPTRRGTTATLSKFFSDIDSGDRLGMQQPETTENLDMALSFYRHAEEKAKTLPADVSTQFIVQQKMNENAQRMALLQKKDSERLASEIYEQILSKLNPMEWEGARSLLYDKQQMMTASLEQERVSIVLMLAEFFTDIDSGDRLSGQQPETTENLDMALSFYQQADEKAEKFPGEVNAQFIAQLKLNEMAARKTSLQEKEQALLAKKTYDRILLALNPSEWTAGRDLLYDQQAFLIDHLTGDDKSNTIGLVGFFKDIDGGDQLIAEGSETMRNLQTAASFYQRADGKARNFPGSIDVVFISELKLSDTNSRIASLQEQQEIQKQRELQAQRELQEQQERQRAAMVAAAPTAEAAAPAVAGKPAPKELDRKTALRWAVKDFKAKSYPSSLQYFTRVYRGQIESIKKGKVLAGLLSLPQKLRGVIVFLIEFERVMESNGNDKEMALEEIMGDIEIGSGLWAGVQENRRNQVVNYISD
jgi:hypothetical protein